jgi:hypothetical protein
MDDTTYPGIINSIKDHLNSGTILIKSYSYFSVHKKI